jgi:hypothetical protein
MISPNDILVTKTDLSLFSTILVITNLVNHQFRNTPLLDDNWKNLSVATLVGVVVHSLLTNKLSFGLKEHINSDNSGINMAIYDLVKFSTIFGAQKLVVSHLEGKKPDFDQEWLMRSSFTIAGYCAFSIAVQSMIPKIDNKYQLLFDDMIKMTMGSLLANYMIDGTITNIRFMELIGLLSSFIIFHIFIKQHIVPPEKFDSGAFSVNAIIPS